LFRSSGVAEDFFGEDFFAEDFFGEDFFGEDFFGEDFLKDSSSGPMLATIRCQSSSFIMLSEVGTVPEQGSRTSYLVRMKLMTEVIFGPGVEREEVIAGLRE
tara:strand:- start:200 stop:505 length:306 start_codon:yes stop_codon:yes gene_type:complete